MRPNSIIMTCTLGLRDWTNKSFHEEKLKNYDTEIKFHEAGKGQMKKSSEFPIAPQISKDQG